jgi:signal peptidase I
MTYEETRVEVGTNNADGKAPDGLDDEVMTNLAPLPETIQTTSTTSSSQKSGSRFIREVVETLILAAIIFFGVRLVVLNFQVDGSSMIPNLEDSEMLLVNRNAYMHFDINKYIDVLPFVDHDSAHNVYPFSPPERGDIVVFNPPNGSSKPYIKRVIGLPGETVSFKEGSVYVNGTKVEEPYLDGDQTGCLRQVCPELVVPEGSVYVMGDNRQNSTDSRSFGPVRIENIIGKAWITYWPFDELGLVPHYDYPGLSG